LSDKHGSQHGVLPGGAGGWISYLPLESFFYKLKTSGYNGFITLKVKPTELWAGNEDRVVQNLEFARGYYEKHFLHYK
jgi:sugar phosphate isomerase/epimerase